jgi:hypothetical protein
MKKLAIGLLAGAGTLLAGGANASDIYARSEYANPGLVQQVRLICNEDGDTSNAATIMIGMTVLAQASASVHLASASGLASAATATAGSVADRSARRWQQGARRSFRRAR